MSILVTGGLGFIGSNLIESLLQEGHKITCVDNHSSARADAYQFVKKHEDRVSFWHECFSHKKILNKIHNKEFDVVFHIAAVPRVSYSVENPYKTTNVNIDKTVKLLEACRGNIDRFIFSSSSSVYGGADLLPTPNTYKKDPKSPYAWQKSAIEDLIKIFVNLYGMDGVCLRYFNVFGPGQFYGGAYSTAVSAWCHATRDGYPLRSDGTGEQSRDMCYIDNVVQANIKAMHCEEKLTGQCLNVACGDRTSNNQILEYFMNNFDSIEVKHAPPRPGDVMHTQADISETQKLLGYEPTVRFWEGLEKTIEWWELSKNGTD